MITFRLPDLGEGLQQAELVSWHVAPGDHVVADQPLLSVETEKAIVDIPSPRSGRISQLHGAPGEMISVGAPLVDFAEPGDAAGDTSTASVVGQLPSTKPPPAMLASTTEPPTPRHAEQAAGVTTASPDTDQVPTTLTADATRVRASPSVRRRAAQLGISLHDIAGSGPGGAIMQSDLAQADSQRGDAAGTSGSKPAGNLRGPMRAMANAMTHAGQHVVPATLNDDAHLAGPLENNSANLMPRLVTAIVAGLRAEPALNASFDNATGQYTENNSIHLGIAVDAPGGLFVPTLRDADTLSSEQVSAQIEQFKVQAAARSLTPDMMRGQTMTLSNFGSLAGRYASLVIMPPQVAILGAGRLREEVVAQNGAPTVLPVLPLSLTFDHRVITGAQAAGFMRAVIQSLKGTGATGAVL